MALDDLYAAVYADPAADAPRQVLADRLLELGDPRGEVIALQMKDPESTRANRLIAAHRHEWLGPISNGYSHEIWRRGFLAELSAEPSRKTVGDPRWNTVESIALVGNGGAQTIFGKPTWRALRVIEGLRRGGLAALLGQRVRPPLEEIDFAFEAPNDIAKLTVFPSLVKLKIDPPKWPAQAKHLAWLWKSAIARQLRELTLELTDEIADVGGFIAAAEPIASIEMLRVTNSYFDLHVTRDATGRFSRLHALNRGVVNDKRYLATLARPLAALPADALVSFRYSKAGRQHPAAALAGVKRAIGRQTRLEEARWK